MLVDHFTFLYAIVYLIFPLSQLMPRSPEFYQSLSWIFISWSLLLQFYIWCIWYKYRSLFREEDPLYLYIPITVHIICHVVLNLIFGFVYFIPCIIFAKLSVCIVIIDFIITWIFGLKEP